jgi:hypothetical protein
MNDVTGGYVDNRTEEERRRAAEVQAMLDRHPDQASVWVWRPWEGMRFIGVQDWRGNWLERMDERP